MKVHHLLAFLFYLLMREEDSYSYSLVYLIQLYYLTYLSFDFSNHWKVLVPNLHFLLLLYQHSKACCLYCYYFIFYFLFVLQSLIQILLFFMEFLSSFNLKYFNYYCFIIRRIQNNFQLSEVLPKLCVSNFILIDFI